MYEYYPTRHKGVVSEVHGSGIFGAQCGHSNNAERVDNPHGIGMPQSQNGHIAFTVSENAHVNSYV